MTFLRRALLVVAVLFLASLVVAPPEARADGDAYPGAYAGWVRSYGMPPIYRGGRYPYGGCGPVAIDRPYCGCGDVGYRGYGWRGAYGTPWSVMRRYLAHEPYRATWHRHPRYWWLRRWPCRYAGAPGWGDQLCAGTEVGPEECPFAKAALGDDGPEGLGVEERLVRGLERFHAGAYDRAAEDFRVAGDAAPSDGRAAYGRLMCAFASKDWPGSADALRRLAAMGLLDARDRVEEEGGFAERRRFTHLADAVVAHVGWNIHDGDARLVAAWALAADGRPEPARAHARAALRANPDDVAVLKIRSDLQAPAPEPPAPAAPSPGPADDGAVARAAR
jgi:hypothetical protein